MKKKFSLSSLLVLLLLVSLVIPAFAEGDNKGSSENRKEVKFDFSDASETPGWAQGYIGKMQSKSIITGYADGTFRPNAPVKRIEAIVMAVRLMELEEEAKAKSPDTPLHFKDANKIPSWGRGHVVVALENGLFDGTEDKIQPDKPASRVWIVNLLVRALGLEDEALKQMTSIPDFKDVNEIPAASIGYVNVAIENGITTGFGDLTFKPNKNVTRGEMAAFLERTNEGLLEQSGALTVQGSITNISFEENNVTEDVYQSSNTETSSTVDDVDGTISIKTFNGEILNYTISSDLTVQYNKKFVTADQLLVNDIVTLVVNNAQVIEANLVDKEDINTNSNVVEFKLEIEADEEELEYKYKNKKGQLDGEIKTETEAEEVKIKGEVAVTQIEELITKLSLTTDMSEEEMLTTLFNTLGVDGSLVEELKLEIKYSNGQKIEVKMEKEDDEEDKDESDEDEKDVAGEGYKGIQSFNLYFSLQDGNKIAVNYEHKNEKVESEFVLELDEEKETLKGEEARLVIEGLLDELAITDETSQEVALQLILNAFEISEDQIEELQLDIKFSSEKEIEVEFENED
jgi:hypothetical protein